MTGDSLDPHFRELGRIQAASDGPDDLLQFRSLVTARQYRPLYAAVRRHFRPADALLDWGCGNGHVSWTLRSLGWRSVAAFAFEEPGLVRRMPEEENIGSGADGRDGAGFSFVRGDPAEPTALPFPDASFDGVLSVGVLEHVAETGGDAAESLREIRRVLKPGGRFLCAHLPNRWSWIEFLARRVPGKFRHQALYRPGEIRRMADHAGFDVVELRSYGFLPRNLWARAPAPFRWSPTWAGIWDGLDAGLGALFRPWVQNHLWVGKKKGS